MTSRTFTGAVDLYWNRAANWSPGDNYPQSGDTATINNQTVRFFYGDGLAGYFLSNLTINGANAVFSNPGGSETRPTLELNGVVTFNLQGTTIIDEAITEDPVSSSTPNAVYTFSQGSGDTTVFKQHLFGNGTTSLIGGTYSVTGIGGGLLNVFVGGQLVLNTNFHDAGGVEVGDGTLDIAGGTFASPLLFDTNFGQGVVDIASGVVIQNGALSGFSPGNQIVFQNQNYSVYGYDGATLTIGSYSFADTFNAGQAFYLSHVGNDTVLSQTPCFLAGTALLTAGGPVAVEALVIGQGLVTASGAVRPIKWIGRRAYARRFARTNPHLNPIVFQAHSLDDGVPARDLRVSREHAMALDGLLVPAWLLINDATIRTAPIETDLLYVHVELETHDIVLAEGAPTETFLDDESRAIFQNAGEYAALYPGDHLQRRFCAPRVREGAALAAIRHRLEARAGACAAGARAAASRAAVAG